VHAGWWQAPPALSITCSPHVAIHQWVLSFPWPLRVLFAAEGSWGVSAIIARRALAIATRLQERGHETISRREAAYSLAVTPRHSAQRVADPDEAEEMLETARDRLDSETYIKEQPSLYAERRVRIDAQAAALEPFHYMSGRFLAKPPVVDTAALRGLAGRLTTLVAECNTMEATTALVQTQRNLLTNLVMVSPLAEADGGADG